MSVKILFVDDDHNILDTFKVLLRKKYDVTTALGPEEGLRFIQSSGAFAVVVSDLKMPKMDGVTFLAKVRQLSPPSVRIILTGFADVGAAIQALNEGHVFRFLTKPCSLETMSKTLDASIKQYRTFTAEKEILQKTLRGSVRVLIEALSMSNPAAYGRTRRIRALVNNLAKSIGMTVPWELDLASMLSHLGCMSLPRNILEDITAGRVLNKSDKALYNSHPSVGAGLIEQIPRLEPISKIVAEHLQDFHTLQSEGARFLKVAVDYDLILSKGLAPYEAYGLMQASKAKYDPILLDALEKSIAEEGGYALKFVTIDELEPGMVLEENIITHKGQLLLKKNASLTAATVETLHKACETFNIVQPIAVIMPSKVKRINLAAIIDSLLELFRQQISVKNIYFTMEIDPSLQSGFLCNESHIKQILFNLLSNAFKFSENGQVSICVYPLYSAASNNLFKILFVVSDSGQGIGDDRVKAIFYPVAMDNNYASSRLQRIMLGLPIVRRLVALLGGTLCVDSNAGVGTDIFFTSCVYVHE